MRRSESVREGRQPMGSAPRAGRGWTRGGDPRLHLALAITLALACAASAEPKRTFVDLQPKANQKLADDLFGREGNNFANVPRGEQKMADTRFLIGEKYVCLKGAHAPDFPTKIEGVKVDAAFDRLQILHAAGWGEPEIQVEDGTEIGAYVIHYADNTTARIPIRYGEDLRDTWDWPPRLEVKRAKVAWIGTSANSEQFDRKVRLFAVVWENPQPAKQVTTIDLESNDTECNPYIFALTLEKKE
jgi:hypothetical protein